jgi:very-short-patch-repair endonuclease
MSRFSSTLDQTARARDLRKRRSLSEARLWPFLRASGLDVAFRRQHPIGPYFADYFCAALRIAVEVDGPLHDQARDAARDAFFAARGIAVLRFNAEDAYSNAEGCTLVIKDFVRARLDERSALNDPD